MSCSNGEVGLEKMGWVGWEYPMFQERCDLDGNSLYRSKRSELTSKEGSDRMVKRRKALLFYRSMHLLWHEVSSGGVSVNFVHKSDFLFWFT